MDSVVPPTVASVILMEAYRAARYLHRYGFEREDLHQELLLHWVRRHHQYDPRRSSSATFASRICYHRCLQLANGAKAGKRGSGVLIRSLSEPVAIGHEGDTAELETTVSYEMILGRRSRPSAELIPLCIDVNRTLSRLPAKVVEVATLLATGMPVVDVARELGISRATANRRKALLQHAFQQAGLGKYVLREAA